MPLSSKPYANPTRRVGAVLVLTAIACAQVLAGDDLGNFLDARGLVGARTATATHYESQPAALRPAPPQADPPATTPLRPADRMSELVVAAMGSLGVPYRRGGNTFDAGYDCSGFVRAIYEQNTGVMLPRQAAQQATATQVIDRGDLQPGDLVFFNTLHRAYSHVGIYVGDHKFIHSPKSGAVVRIEDMRVSYWHQRFDGARRVTGQGLRPTAMGQAYSTSSSAYPNY